MRSAARRSASPVAAKKPRKSKAPSVPHASLTDAEAASLVETARVSFEVPGPPVPCARARVSVRKHVDGSGHERTFARAYTPASTKAYERTASLHARNAVNRCRAWRRDAQAYRVRLTFYRDVARGDWDNHAKAVGDAMNGVVYEDDRQICDAVVSVRTDRENPRTVVEVVMLEVNK